MQRLPAGLADAPSQRVIAEADVNLRRIVASGLADDVGQPVDEQRNLPPVITITGKWLQETGFSTGQPLKLRVMPGCLVITVQDISELWHCLEGLSRESFDERAAADWLNRFPGRLGLAGIMEND
ncbi:SymE family type I addiction module toxin [Brenneria sp. g21c3]|uniref:SymE family type I addiction module toxin n=1 Tax=Brenneria sp. g21c3 TaxID=3093893 RepID=UPI002EA38EDD|nr:SymE family type I addiction module toxin [Brenneria sp. g21c3]